MKTMREIIDTASPAPLLEGRALYETDEHAWIEQQIVALREGDIARVDRDSLVEYLTEMTIHDKRELESRLVVLVMHLLKIRFQPEKLSRSWIRTIMEQQQQIGSLLKGIPSLRPQAGSFLESAYPAAVRQAAAETGISASKFPTTCPWTVDEALAFEPPMVDQKPRRRQ